PPGLTVDAASGLVAGTLSSAGRYAVTASASDGFASSSRTFLWDVRTTNAAPVLTAPGDQINRPGESVVLLLLAADPDGNTLTYSVSGFPAGLVVDPDTGRVSGKLTTLGTWAITATASDGVLSSPQSFTWAVVDNRAP